MDLAKVKQLVNSKINSRTRTLSDSKATIFPPLQAWSHQMDHICSVGRMWGLKSARLGSHPSYVSC